MGQISNLNSHPQVKLLKYYPISIFLSYSVGSIYRIILAIDSNVKLEFIGEIHFVMFSLMGFFNSVVFFTRPVVLI